MKSYFGVVLKILSQYLIDISIRFRTYKYILKIYSYLRNNNNNETLQTYLTTLRINFQNFRRELPL